MYNAVASLASYCVCIALWICWLPSIIVNLCSLHAGFYTMCAWSGCWKSIVHAWYIHGMNAIHGACMVHACHMHENIPISHMFHACSMHVPWNIHACGTCMKHACFLCSFSSRGVALPQKCKEILESGRCTLIGSSSSFRLQTKTIVKLIFWAI